MPMPAWAAAARVTSSKWPTAGRIGERGDGVPPWGRSRCRAACGVVDLLHWRARPVTAISMAGLPMLEDPGGTLARASRAGVMAMAAAAVSVTQTAAGRAPLDLGV